jgi:hypothetical protein
MKKETLPNFTSFLIGFGFMILIYSVHKLSQLLN